MNSKIITSEKKDLIMYVYAGGVRGMQSIGKLIDIEIKEAIDLERQNNNRVISASTLVEMLNINGLNTKILHEWFVNEMKLGTYEKPHGEKKRVFQPNETFCKWVSLKGYSFTGKTNDGRKIRVLYSTIMADRIQDKHIKSLSEYVKMNTYKN